MQTFQNLDLEKQKRIINASLQEFAENGFDKASTNQIVKNANIGKGMLFYYFNNKKDLYLYLVHYALDAIDTEFLEKIDKNEPDFIERFKQIAQVKMAYQLKSPFVFGFLGKVFIQEEFDLTGKLQDRYEEIMKKSHSIMYDNIDIALFREDVDTEKAFKLIQWSMEGYQNDLVRQFKYKDLVMTGLEPYWDEFYEYLEVLKTIFYK